MEQTGEGRPEAAELPLDMVLSTVLQVLGNQIESLELAVSVFERAQRMLPIPAPAELAEMRQGSRPVGRTTYLLGFFQRASAALEEIATALRNELEDGTEDVQREGLSALDLKCIEQAIQYVREAGALEPEAR